MDWSKLFDVSMVMSVARWALTAWGSQAYMQDWIAGHQNEWGAIMAGGVALASLAWSLVVASKNKKA